MNRAEVVALHHLVIDYNDPNYGNCECGYVTGFQEDPDCVVDEEWWACWDAHLLSEINKATGLQGFIRRLITAIKSI